MLEYGSATVEIHADACRPGQRVLIVDDLIATGGTLLAAAKLFRVLRGDVVGVAAVIDLPEIGGSAKLRADGLKVHALCEFSETGASGRSQRRGETGEIWPFPISPRPPCPLC